MDRAQRHFPPDYEIKLIHKLPADYIRRWSATTDDSFISEGQVVMMVCFDRRTAVGYACLDVRLNHELHDTNYQVGVEAELVYVVPSRRGEGFGMDLSVACGWLVSDILSATYRAVPPNSEITSCVSADLRSKGGEAFANHLRNSLEITIDDLKHCGARRTIKFGEVEDEAGW